jgi:hypothetical protein
MRKKALYIGFKRDYVNKYLELSLSVLGNCFDLNFYGPGYSKSQEIEDGINSWLKNQNEYDILFIDPFIVIHENKLTLQEFTRNMKMNILYYGYDDFYDNVDSYKNFFFDSPKTKVIIGVYDYHAINNNLIKYIVESNSLVISVFGKNLNDSLENTKKKYGESDFYDMAISDSWYEFECNYKERIISFPHAVFTNEFNNTPIGSRKYIFSVVGVLYPERKKAAKFLPLEQRLLLFFKRLIIYIKTKTGLNQITPKKLNHYFFSYNKTISNSKLVYCSGSPLMYSVRKYFEIPSKGSVSIGWPCNGFQHLGFKDKENFIIAKNNSELEEAFLNYSEIELQKIATNGLKLIWEHHSDYARTEQMKKTFSLIFSGKFKGSYWKNGEYLFF